MIKTLTSLAIVFTINVNAQIITTFAGNGTGAYGGDGATAITAEIYNPNGVAFDAAGNLYIADNGNSRIRKVNTAGIISTTAGNGILGYSGDGGQATNAELSGFSVAFDTAGNLYITDSYNNCIRKVIMSTGIISTIAGNGTLGYSGDGGQATNAELKNPTGIAFDASGNLYIADFANNRIRMINTAGIINTIAGTGTAGYSGDGAQAANAELYAPSAITFDTFNNLFIADEGNVRIRKVNTAGVITTIAGNGTLGYSGDGVQATTAELHAPQGLIFDSFNNLYISDAGNNRIRMVNTSGIISTVVANGTQGYSGDGGQATGAELYSPNGVALDISGNLYIADWGNNRIRKVTNAAVTDIQQFENSNEQVKIYPNPNKGSFVIEPNSEIKQTVQVYDVNGKMVLNQAINSKTAIDATSLNEGVYQVSIQSSDFRITKRLVIVR